MWKTLLWLSLGAAIGVTGSAVYVHLTQQVPVVTAAPACPSVLHDAGADIDMEFTPRGHILPLSK